ncbi:MAG: hypothetical protein KKC80_05290 [Candidatus Margulisbacteria bacterium]|nr:hypothetical protein [Candidatus Margulisiibacteriota bacterium]MBU1616619.1 hypothetical protein [Candidatus Margulisiibacteriota bacterium]
MDLATWLAIANLGLTFVLTGFAIICTWWWSGYRKMLPWEIAKKHYIEVVKRNLCPKCASKNIEIIPEIITGSDFEDVCYAGYDHGKCKDCKHEWDFDFSHFSN